MKKMRIVFASLLMLGVSAGAFAQTEALIGGEYTYTAKAAPAADSYDWTLSGGTTTLAAVNAATTQGITFTWDNATAESTYTLNVYGILHGCAGDDYTKTFIAKTQLSYTASWISSTNTCPATTKNPGGGVDAAFTLQVTVNAGAALTTADNVTVSFTVDGIAQTPVTVHPDASGNVTIPVTLADKTNTTGADIVKNVVVMGVAIVGRNPVSIPNNARPAGTFSIWALPVITDIF